MWYSKKLFQSCPFPANLLQLANGYGGMSKHEVSPNNSICDGSLNNLDQQLNMSLMKLNGPPKNNLPSVSSSKDSCSSITPISCSGPGSCSNSHQSPPVYSPIGFPRNLSSRSSNHNQQVRKMFPWFYFWFFFFPLSPCVPWMFFYRAYRNKRLSFIN